MTTKSRDHRIDFFRGAALAVIFINHVPGNIWERFTHKNFGFSDAAEIFVLLAGFASAYAYFAPFARGEKWEAMRRTWARAGVLYMSHIVTTVIGISFFAAAAVYFSNPAYLDDSLIYVNIKPFFEDPARGMVGVATLGHQLGYFNILSMYAVILLMLPGMLWLADRNVRLLLGASLAMWLIAGMFTIDMPNYPLQGGWFFNPFAWQLLFAIGLFLGIKARRNEALNIPVWVIWLSAAYLLASLLWIKFELWSWQPALPEGWWWFQHFYMFDKTYVSIPRLLHVLALAIVVLAPPWGQWLRRIPAHNALTAMGRNSLPVFCAGSLLAMAGAIARHQLGGGLVVDTVIVGLGLAVMIALARLLDNRKHPHLKKVLVTSAAPETPLQSPPVGARSRPAL